MDTSVQLALKIAASAAIGLLLGLEREWAHKEAGVRTFAIAALLGTISWQIAPVLAYAQFGIVALIILLVNIYTVWKEGQPQITTSLALASTNVLGAAIGAGNFFLAFAGAIAIATLLSWKTELVTLSGKLTVKEIRGALLLAFISGVIYPLLPAQPLDPWKILDLRMVWLTVILVSALKFVNYVLLRIFGERGLRYSSLLGGLVNSAAMSFFLGDEARANAHTEQEATGNMLLAGAAMILRNWVLVLLFALPNFQRTLPTIIVLAPMMCVASASAGLALWRSQRTSRGKVEERPGQQERRSSPLQSVAQRSPDERDGENGEDGEHSEKRDEQEKKQLIKSPLSLLSVFNFTLIFLILTIFSGAGRVLFGATGFLIVIVVGALASAASSAVLLGEELTKGLVSASPAALAMFLATVAGLLENVVIFWSVARKPAPGVRILLLTLPVIASGIVMVILLSMFHW